MRAEILLVAALCACCRRTADAFSPSPRVGALVHRYHRAPSSPIVVSMSDDKAGDSATKKGEGDSGFSSFDDAAKAIRDEEDAEALARGSGMSEEEEAEYQSRSDEFASMKDRIKSRASELGVQKSVATAEAIKQAELRAKNMAASGTNAELDMSVFEKRMLSNPEDELSDEEQAEIDPIGELSFFEQAMDEFSNTKLPGPIDVAKTVGFMIVVGVVSSFVILKSDTFLRQLYTDWGFIPAPGAKLDYSDLALPADWNKDLNDLSGVFDAATKTLGVKVPDVAPTLNVDVPTDL